MELCMPLFFFASGPATALSTSGDSPKKISDRHRPEPSRATKNLRIDLYKVEN